MSPELNGVFPERYWLNPTWHSEPEKLRMSVLHVGAPDK